MADHEITRRQFVRDGSLAAFALAAGLNGTQTVRAGEADEQDAKKIRSYNPQMEYRRCGRTNFMVSAVALGGHWKRIDKVLGADRKGGWIDNDKESGFDQNRRDVVTRCLERGINWVDACCIQEVRAYSKALKGRREAMYMACSWEQIEVRRPQYRTLDKLKETMDWGLKDGGIDYCDVWRITCHEKSSRHSDAEMDVVMQALEWARKTGRARYVGISSHDRPHIKRMIETYPDVLDVICTPYTAKTKVVTDDSGLWATMQKHDIGWFGIKPFASNSIFKGDSSLDSPTLEEDDRIARLAIRYILCNPAITAPIPGLISPQQVDNVALAVVERRELDLEERAELERAMDDAWANLPYHYQWLRDWEYV
jgi:aryl-alcohol dehydrogenase-like predicted oxidoreductase